MAAGAAPPAPVPTPRPGLPLPPPSLPLALRSPRRECFKDTPWVKVPKVEWNLSAASVLTMEYTPGVKINKGAPGVRLEGGREREGRLRLRVGRGAQVNEGGARASALPPLESAAVPCRAGQAVGGAGARGACLHVYMQPSPRPLPAALLSPAVKELDALGVDRSLLARRAVESYLQQLLNHGFFHAGEWVGGGC